jgi:hypothetical protein
MNEHNESEMALPPIISPQISDVPEYPEPKPFSYWVRRFLGCNPFYLISAALLLFGLYRVSVDRSFIEKELSQLAFTLTSLQSYEILLVVTAVFLARRRIWYDSTLLVSLENMFLFVPFILVGQLSLLDKPVVWIVCPVCTLMAVARAGVLKRFFRELNLPNRLLGIGFVLVLVNIGLLVAYRIVGETKMGGKPDSGSDFMMNQVTWLVILPAALALANFLPHARETGSLLPQRRWLPTGFFSLWIVTTGAHLYCLNYVYDFAFRAEMLAPVFWVLGWTAYRRAPEFLAVQNRSLENALAIAPIFIPLLAASESGNKIFFVLTMLNAAIYGGLCFFRRDNRLVPHLMAASIVLLVCALPGEWVRFATPDFQRGNYIAAGVALYFLIYTALSRNPKMGIFGSIAVMITVLVLFQGHAETIHWALQSGLVFLLLHSLLWDDARHEGARAVRIMAATLWVIHAFAWMHFDVRMWMACIPGGVVLATYLIAQLLRGRWDRFILPAASILTVLAGPGNALIGTVQSTPGGLLAVIGSFLLFAIGTAMALTKHHWHGSSREL